MRILAVSHPSVVDVNQRVYRSLERMGHDLAIVVPARWRHEYAQGDVRPRRLEGFTGAILPVPIALPGNIPLHAYLARARKVVRRVAPDVVFAEAEAYSVAAFQWTTAAAALGIPAFFYAAQNLARRYPAPMRLMESRVWAASQGAAAVSDEAQAALRSRGYRGRVDIVPLSVDTEAFAGTRRDNELGSRLGLRRFVVGFAGRLVPEKGIEVLLRAHDVMAMRDETSILVVGSGPLEGTCAGHDGAVVATGVEHLEVPRYLALMDLLAIPSLTTPSWKEQFGRVAVEAMATGVPVVASDSGHLPQLMSETGGGIVVPEGDPVTLARELDRLLLDREARAALSRQGSQAVNERFSNAAAATRLAALLGSHVA